MSKFSLTIILSVFLLSSCSVYMAANQPNKKDLSILKAGTPRDLVIAEFGTPVFSEMSEEGRIEIFEFYHGSAKGWKTGRAVFHAVADVFTLGLWEIVGTPTEHIVKGDMIKARVMYDENDKVKFSEIFGDDSTTEEKETDPVDEDGMEAINNSD